LDAITGKEKIEAEIKKIELKKKNTQEDLDNV